jgi:hypothetical protein
VSKWRVAVMLFAVSCSSSEAVSPIPFTATPGAGGAVSGGVGVGGEGGSVGDEGGSSAWVPPVIFIPPPPVEEMVCTCTVEDAAVLRPCHEDCLGRPSVCAQDVDDNGDPTPPECFPTW